MLQEPVKPPAGDAVVTGGRVVGSGWGAGCVTGGGNPQDALSGKRTPPLGHEQVKEPGLLVQSSWHGRWKLVVHSSMSVHEILS